MYKLLCDYYIAILQLQLSYIHCTKAPETVEREARMQHRHCSYVQHAVCQETHHHSQRRAPVSQPQKHPGWNTIDAQV